jgi:uncharacterized surface protein with fasciclin (FAS1) repeats
LAVNLVNFFATGLDYRTRKPNDYERFERFLIGSKERTTMLRLNQTLALSASFGLIATFGSVPAFAGATCTGCTASKNATMASKEKAEKKGYVKADKNIVETASAAGKFETLIAAAKAAGLADALTGDDKLTVLAPTNEAFAALPEGTVESLLKPENKAQLAAILKLHVISGKVMAKDVVKASDVATLNGEFLAINASDEGVKIGEANVIKTDIKASNGVIHVIDKVLLPKPDLAETADAAGTFKTLLAAAEAAGLTSALKGDGPLTVFAPTDDAFAALPEGTVESLLKPENQDKLASILKYHIIADNLLASEVLAEKKLKTLQGDKLKVAMDGGTPKIGGAAITATDIQAGNGVIHVIDRVLVPSE